VDEPDRDGVQEVQLFAAAPASQHEPRFLELLQVLHDAEARHLEALLERAQRLAVCAEELVEEAPPSGIGQRPEHLIHARTICDHSVTCQGLSR